MIPADEPILGLAVAFVAAGVPAFAMAIKIGHPNAPRWPLFAVALVWGLTHLAAWLWSFQSGVLTALDVYAEFNAGVGLVAAAVIAFWRD